MGFGDINSAVGQGALNTFLQDRSYIEGYVPSQSDVAVFEAMSGAPDAKFNHALRWYNHIISYKSGFSSLPGVKKPIDEYGAAAPCNGHAKAAADDSDSDDEDLFGSESEDEETKKAAEELRQKRLAEYAAKKANKKTVIAKSSLLLDVKPWDDETDMKELEAGVRKIEKDGLLWGISKLVPVGYGIHKLQIAAVIEDDKISTDWLEEEITANEDFVQSMDIAAFNKV